MLPVLVDVRATTIPGGNQITARYLNDNGRKRAAHRTLKGANKEERNAEVLALLEEIGVVRK